MRDGNVALSVEIPTELTSCLRPNSRCHWRRKAREVQTARETARLAAVDAINRGMYARRLPDEGDIGLNITVWHKRRSTLMDADNALASCKSLIDGVFDALGANDKRVTEFAVKQHRAETDPMVGIAVIALER